MFEFVAIGPGVKQRWRRSLTTGEVVRLGRAPEHGWAVPWDMRISREHADLCLEGNRLHVRRLATARNSIYCRGEACEDFTVGPGEDFRIGATVFRLKLASAESRPPPRSPAPAEAADFREVLKQPEQRRLEAILARIDEEETRLESSAAKPREAEGGRDLRRLHAIPEIREAPEIRDAASEPQSDIWDGTAFGHYELVDQVHRGRPGQVLKARHRFLSRWAAIKLLSPWQAPAERLARFRRATRLLGRFDHDNIIRLFDAGSIEMTHYAILEFAEGGDLAACAWGEGVSIAQGVQYTLQAARGLAQAHRQRVIHRDVNPQHLLLAETGVVKLTGWGGARCVADGPLDEFELSNRSIGTPGFQAPEQVADSRVADERSDIFSLGCTLLSILGGRTAVGGGRPAEELLRPGTDTAPSLRAFRPDAPEALDEICRKMLAKSPADRYQTMHEVLEALATVL